MKVLLKLVVVAAVVFSVPVMAEEGRNTKEDMRAGQLECMNKQAKPDAASNDRAAAQAERAHNAQ